MVSMAIMWQNEPFCTKLNGKNYLRVSPDVPTGIRHAIQNMLRIHRQTYTHTKKHGNNNKGKFHPRTGHEDPEGSRGIRGVAEK